MNECKICQNKIVYTLDLGAQPLANGFSIEREKAKEKVYDLKVGQCLSCGMVQIAEQPDANAMFNNEYPFFTSSSEYMVRHFNDLAEWLQLEDILKPGEKLIEVGCNDGSFLTELKRAGFDVLGVDPSDNVANVAKKRGVPVLVDFFGRETVNKIRTLFGSEVQVLCGSNVFCHIFDIREFLTSCNLVLSDSGFVVFEDPYWGAISDLGSFDQIYDEHVFLFSVSSVNKLADLTGFTLVDCLPLPVHGGSMRYVLRKGSWPHSERVEAHMATEKDKGLVNGSAFAKFTDRVKSFRSKFEAFLDRCVTEGKEVIGYGATSKSSTVLSYINADSASSIQHIVDSTPEKIGKFSPGVGVAIVPPEDQWINGADVIILFAWNHKEEILKKEWTRFHSEKNQEVLALFPDIEAL